MSNSGWLGVGFVVAGYLDFLGQAELGEHPDDVEVGVDLIPGEAVTAETGWAWWLLCQPSPPVIRATQKLLRESSRVSKAAAAPEVGGRVDQPGGVEAEGHAQEDAPENHLETAHDAVVDPCAEAEQNNAAGDQR